MGASLQKPVALSYMKRETKPAQLYTHRDTHKQSPKESAAHTPRAATHRNVDAHTHIHTQAHTPTSSEIGPHGQTGTRSSLTSRTGNTKTDTNSYTGKHSHRHRKMCTGFTNPQRCSHAHLGAGTDTHSDTHAETQTQQCYPRDQEYKDAFSPHPGAS